MKQTPSYFDVSGNNEEKFYHGMILGMTACLSSTHIIRSNRESGEGRYDICIEPTAKDRIFNSLHGSCSGKTLKKNQSNNTFSDVNKNEKGIIIELKAGKENENLDILAQKAYDQIQTKEYKREMESSGIKEIIPVGIAFSGKKVKVKYY